jgi:hypothetical protein
MRSNSQNTARARDRAHEGRSESPQSNATFPRRTERPGAAGLANERRPGLGSRGPAKRGQAKAKAVRQDAEPLGRNAPLRQREPREQKPDSRAAEQERDTSASGQMGLK